MIDRRRRAGPARTSADDAARPLRILLVTDKVPGHDSGYGIRVANVIDGLRSAGDLHAVLIDSSRFGERLTEGLGYTTELLRIRNPPRWQRGLRLLRLLPANVRYHRSAAARATLQRSLGTEPWDVVWCSRARVQVLTDGVIHGPRIVDFDDLNDRLLRTEIADRTAVRGPVSTLPRSTRDLLDARLWSRLQRRIASRVDRVVVCSPADREHIGVTNGAVVPNGYPDPVGVVRSRDAAARHRILFVGPLTYEPNRLGVEWFLDHVYPVIRSAVADVEFVVVGDDDGVTVRGADQPGVTLAGRVPDVAVHYAEASIAIAPLHSGGGTRIKVIEALARSVPLVSTSFGQIGHELEPGLVAVADEPASFADECIALLCDPERRSAVAERGRETFERRLTARATSTTVAALARRTASRGRHPARQADHGQLVHEA